MEAEAARVAREEAADNNRPRTEEEWAPMHPSALPAPLTGNMAAHLSKRWPTVGELLQAVRLNPCDVLLEKHCGEGTLQALCRSFDQAGLDWRPARRAA